MLSSYVNLVRPPDWEEEEEEEEEMPMSGSMKFLEIDIFICFRFWICFYFT